MTERAHPEDAGFKGRWFGLIGTKYRRKLYERYRFCKRYVKRKRVLDIPCGVGWGTSLLRGAKSVVGIDISAEAVAYAQSHYQNDQRQFRVGNMEAIPLDANVVDSIVCLEGFEHVSEETGKAFLAESARVLVESGLLILTCPVLDGRGETTGNPYHLCEYPEEVLIGMLNANFRILYLERVQGPDGPEYQAVLENIKNGRYKS